MTKTSWAFPRKLWIVLAAVTMVFIKPGSTAADCRSDGAEFQQRLTPVVMAAVDNKPAAQAPAVTRASSWWHEHRSAQKSPANGDRMVSMMGKATSMRRTTEAARLAIEASLASWRGCGTQPTVADRVRLVHLGALVALLRSTGQRADLPAELTRSIELLTQHLRSTNRAPLASKLALAGHGVYDSTRTGARARQAARDLMAVINEIDRALP